MFIAAKFITHTGNSLGSPSIDEHIIYTYIMDYYSEIKQNELLILHISI